MKHAQAALFIDKYNGCSCLLVVDIAEPIEAVLLRAARRKQELVFVAKVTVSLPIGLLKALWTIATPSRCIRKSRRFVGKGGIAGLDEH